MIEPFAAKSAIAFYWNCSDLSESQMEEIKSLTAGDKITYKGVEATVTGVYEYDGVIAALCEPISIEEAQKLPNFPKPKTWKEKFEEWQRVGLGGCRRCDEEIRRRKAAETRAENAESQVKMLKLANDDLWRKREGLCRMAQIRMIKRAAEIEEIHVKLQTVTGITPERMLELFLEGYTLQPPENLNLANLLKGN